MQILYNAGEAHLVGSSQLLKLGLRIWVSRILVWVHLLDLAHLETDNW